MPFFIDSDTVPVESTSLYCRSACIVRVFRVCNFLSNFGSEPCYYLPATKTRKKVPSDVEKLFGKVDHQSTIISNGKRDRAGLGSRPFSFCIMYYEIPDPRIRPTNSTNPQRIYSISYYFLQRHLYSTQRTIPLLSRGEV